MGLPAAAPTPARSPAAHETFADLLAGFRGPLGRSLAAPVEVQRGEAVGGRAPGVGGPIDGGVAKV